MILILTVMIFLAALAYNYHKNLQIVSEENTRLHMEIAEYKQDLDNLQEINRNMNSKLFI